MDALHSSFDLAGALSGRHPDDRLRLAIIRYSEDPGDDVM